MYQEKAGEDTVCTCSQQNRHFDIQEKRQQVQLQFAKRNIKWSLLIMHIYLFSKQRFQADVFFQPVVQNRL